MKRLVAIFSLCCGLGLTVLAQESRTTDLQSFTDLELEGVFDVELVQGNKNQVVVEAPAEYIDLVTVEQSGDRVEVGMENERRYKKLRDIKVTVYLTDLRQIEASMVGDLYNQQPLRLSKLRVETSMVGDARLQLEVEDLVYHSSSVGDTKLAGMATTADFENSSVGDFAARELKARRLSIENSSVGNFEAYASEEVEVENSGIGRVYITGGAKATRLDNSGIGKVKIE
jgi:hypothetical protein